MTTMRCHFCDADVAATKDLRGSVSPMVHDAPCGVPCEGSDWSHDRATSQAARAGKMHGGDPPHELAVTLPEGGMFTMWCPKCGIIHIDAMPPPGGPS